MKVSVIGCGNISATHFRVLSSLDFAEISSAADCKKERAEKKSEEYSCKAYDNYISMLDEDKPDCVHICTPHNLHVEMAIEALKRGINVLCEKPCAIGAQELKALQKAQRESTAQFGVCFQNRYNEPVRKIKSIIESGEYGAVKGIRANVCWCRKANYYCDEWHGKKELEGGGVLVNQAIHTLDLIRYLSGSDVKYVNAHAFNDTLSGVIETEDSATVRYEFENGSVALLYATVGFSLDSDVLIDVFCEKATFRIEGAYNAYIIEKGEIRKLAEGVNTLKNSKAYWGSGHTALIEDFYEKINTGNPFPIDSFEGGKAVSEFLACYESSEKGEKVRVKY